MFYFASNEYWMNSMISASRLSQKGVQFLIKWKGYPESESSWILHKKCDCEWLIKKFMKKNCRKVRSSISSAGMFYLEFSLSFVNIRICRWISFIRLGTWSHYLRALFYLEYGFQIFNSLFWADFKAILMTMGGWVDGSTVYLPFY